MTEIWIDPSYTGTGVAIFNYYSKVVTLGLFGNNNSKRSLIKFFVESLNLSRQFKDWMYTKRLSLPVHVYIEYPPPTGQSSAGLYGLQFMLLNYLRTVTNHIYGINPKYISTHVKKIKGTDSISTRKNFAIEYLDSLKNQGWKIEGEFLLKKAGCDVQTALLFKHISNLRNKEWLSYEQELEEIDG